MIKKLTILAVGFILLGVATFTLSSKVDSIALDSAQTDSPEIPDYILYGHLFRHAAAYKARADGLELQGKDARHFHNFFKNKANLSDGQARILNLISTQYATEILAIDGRAKLIVQIYKAQYPNGQVPHGQLPAAPPAELRELTRERNELVLRKRDELRIAFGEEAFERFQEFVKSKIASNVTPISAEQ